MKVATANPKPMIADVVNESKFAEKKNLLKLLFYTLKAF